ncbi:MAG: TlpA family protein disulfide reductase [Bacteroidota bacterium]
MKKYCPCAALTLFLLILFSGCQQQAGISADLGFPGNDTVYITRIPLNGSAKQTTDTVVTEKGRFRLDPEVQDLYFCSLYTGKMITSMENGDDFLFPAKTVDFFIGPRDRIKIRAEMKEKLTVYTAEGNELSRQMSTYRELVSPLYAEQAQTLLDLENLYFLNDTAAGIAALSERLSVLFYRSDSLLKAYIQEHPDHELSAYLLLRERKDDILKYFPGLSAEVQASVCGQILDKKIVAWQRTAPGTPAPAFRYATLSGDTLSLQDLRGKYTVLDFWGPWCHPCVSGMPEMKNYYEKYRDKAAFVGIACRTDRETWAAAVGNLGLSWIQILNDENGEDLSALYGIEGYPTKIIIDREGKILRVFLGESPEFYEELDKLLSL